MIVSMMLLVALGEPRQVLSRVEAEKLVRKVLAGDEDSIFVLRKHKSAEKELVIVRFWPQAKTNDLKLSLVNAMGWPVTKEGRQLLNVCASSKDYRIKIEALRTLHRFEEAKKVPIPSSGPPPYPSSPDVP